MGYPHGLFGWVDLVTTDVSAARAFYTSLLGWEPVEVALPSGAAHTLFLSGGNVVAGMAAQPAGMAGTSPSTWNSYVLVDDVDKVINLVGAAGGTTVVGGLDVMDRGPMAMIADPAGAVVGVWQPRGQHGAEVFNTPGALTWNELQTRDLDGALGFYEHVFGWHWECDPGTGYCTAVVGAESGGRRRNAGAMALPDTAPSDAPNFWAVYFAVESCPATLARAAQLGGDVFLPAMEMGGRVLGGVTDPTGAQVMFASGSTSGR
jgi:uncharacterized protein